MLQDLLNSYSKKLESELFVQYGLVSRINGLLIEAKGLQVSLGHMCTIELHTQEVEAQVVGFTEKSLFLMALDSMGEIFPGARVRCKNVFASIKVNAALLGRIIDGNGQPLDDKGPIVDGLERKIVAQSINPLKRIPLSKPLDVGVRAINGLLPVAKGQRMGLFAGSGVGKSVLLGMMTRYTKADVVVIALIGERGREVRDFIEKSIGAVGLKKTIVIASPADSSPIQRINGALTACTIAEYFRDQKKDVLLIMDSLTRFAHAKRQIALSMGEPPAHKGYTPSVFSDMASLIERAGASENGGSITAFYTVLADGDDIQDPIVDAARSFLDGQIVLSRDIADLGIYPAIHVGQSISRVMTDIAQEEHLKDIMKFKRYQTVYEENRDLINIGAYQKGMNPDLDASIQHRTAMIHFLVQGLDKPSDYTSSIQQLHGLFVNQGLEIHGS